MSGQRRSDRFNDQRQREAVRLDQERVISTAIDWYRETLRLFDAKTQDALTWDDLSDYERGLFRAVENYEQRKVGRR